MQTAALLLMLLLATKKFLCFGWCRFDWESCQDCLGRPRITVFSTKPHFLLVFSSALDLGVLFPLNYVACGSPDGCIGSVEDIVQVDTVTMQQQRVKEMPREELEQ